VNYAQTKGIRTFDYFESETFQIKNAYTTAEAALNIAMNNLVKNIKGSRVAVTGYGRIAKQLVRLLRLLDVNVTLLARKDSDLTWAALEGCQTLKLPQSKNDANTVMKLTRGYDVIFNTVPHWLFDRDFLELMDKKTFIIDLASVPGGVDICAANELRANVLWAASLPGKYAPVSAGMLIASCVDGILREEVGYK
jgi:dipicolinate synthase subunit A